MSHSQKRSSKGQHSKHLMVPKSSGTRPDSIASYRTSRHSKNGPSRKTHVGFSDNMSTASSSSFGNQSHRSLRHSVLGISKAASLVGSATSADSRSRVKSYPVWSEFSENEVNAEKWDSAGKGKEKGKSPNPQTFDDPEGRIEMPPSVRVHEWKRTHDFLQSTDACVVLDEKQTDLDLLTPNEHLCHSELMRWIISQISSMWNISVKKTNPAMSSARAVSTPDVTDDTDWRPWHHIFSQNKVGKGPPLYNSYGKYIVRLYWMGCWRKIVVDDQFPFDSEGRLLLPATSNKFELWPLLLSKALIKIASINYNMSNVGCEFGDFFVMHSLTGWLPETIPLQYGHMQNVWDLLKVLLPSWKRPEAKPEESDAVPLAPNPSKKDRMETSAVKDVGSAQKGGKGGKDKKKEEREKSKSATHSTRPHSARSVTDIKSAVEESHVEKTPETVVFVSFTHPTENPPRVHMLKEMADSSEKLRKVGLSHLHPHPLQVTQVRDMPLVEPPPVPVIPLWKQIRPRKKRTTPSDEPIAEPEPPKPDQWLEITSEYVNHKISPLPFDPNSAKSRASPRGLKGSRPSTAGTLKDIDEENQNTTDGAKEDGIFRAQQVSSMSKRSNKSRQSVDFIAPDDITSRGPSVNGQNESNKDSSETVNNPDKAESLLDERESSQPAEVVNKKMWIDFEDFCKCFQTLVIFHKPATYKCTLGSTEIKYSVINGLNTTTSSKKGSANLSGSSTNVKSGGIQNASKTYEGFPVEERQPVFLFVDHEEPIELIVSLSVLSRWPGMESERGRVYSDKDSVAGVSEVLSSKDPSYESAPQGLMVAEQYTWKTMVTGQPVLRIRTSGVRASCLNLPAGRHVLKLMFDTPLGYSLCVTSRVEFNIGDEESIMKCLENESCRYKATARHIMEGIDQCIQSIGNKEEWMKARRQLHQAHMPFNATKKYTKSMHYTIWNQAFYKTMLELSSDDSEKSLMRALRLFTLDCSPMEVLSTWLQKDEGEIHEHWVDRKPTPEEIKAVVRIQASYRGYRTRKIHKRWHLNDEEASTTKEVLVKAWDLIKPNVEENGLRILRNMFAQDENLMSKYSFYKDEWNRICYEDYTGQYSEQPANSWFIVFREVFYATEAVMCQPRLYIPLRTCVLRVVDNDTNTELSSVFQKVLPHTYKKNKRGYTFVAEAYSTNTIQADKWKMRLIGSKAPLPAPITMGQVNTQFAVKEIKDYFVPNEKNIILRYHVKTSSNHIASIQLRTSRPDVYIKLQILDNEEEVVSTNGKGHCVVPAFCFLTNEKAERPSSRISNQESRHMVVQQSKASVSGKKRTGSAKSKDGKTSPKQPRKPSGESGKVPPSTTAQVISQPEDEEDSVVHKYVIQATVERKSWPLSESQWSFVQKLRDMEKEEIRAFSDPSKPEIITTSDTNPSSPVASPRSSRLLKSRNPLSRSTSSIPATSRLSIPVTPADSGPSRLSSIVSRTSFVSRYSWGASHGPKGGFSRSYPSVMTAHKDRPGSPNANRASIAGKPSTGEKGKKGGKGGDKKKTADKEIGSRPQSQSMFDDTKAHWMLRFVSDADLAENVDIRKDIDRQEEIRAMKLAWEAAEPGRAIKALQSRLAYLNKKGINKENEIEEEAQKDDQESVSEEQKLDVVTLNPPSHLIPKPIFEEMDLNLYFSPKPSEKNKMYYLNEEIKLMQENMAKEEIDSYNILREEVIQSRDKEKNDRLKLKQDQLKTYQDMQYTLDKSRFELFKPREEYRQSLLDEERRKKEEEEARLAALEGEERVGSASPKGKKSGKKSGKKK